MKLRNLYETITVFLIESKNAHAKWLMDANMTHYYGSFSEKSLILRYQKLLANDFINIV